ncbi:MAG: restriction endonuclease subunit S [Rhizobacter sp.]|nr:restriction endonuclease subunit S [Rhizobacter sp.]
MNALLEAREPSARYLEAVEPALVRQFDLVAGVPGGVAQLRELILSLAVRGKLVPQDPSDDPTRLDVVAEQVFRLIQEGKVPRSRASELLENRSNETELPVGWAAVRGSDVFIPRSGNSKLIKGKLFPEPGEGLYAGYSASGQDVWLSSFEYDGTAVILSAVGARCGKAFLARDKWSAIANTHIVWPIEATVSAEYAMLLLNDENFWIRSGGAQPFLKVTETLQRTVLIPPFEEQARIVARVDELMRLCDALEAEGRLEAQQHARLLGVLLGTLTDSSTPEELAANWQRVAAHFDLLLDRPEAVDALEQTILQSAVRGLLVRQDPGDEPASVLLQKIRTERDRLISEGKIKRDKPLSPIADEDAPFDLPQGWEWVRMQGAFDVRDGTHDTPKYVERDGVPLITSRNFEAGRICFEDAKLISQADHELIMRRSRVERYDILYSMIGGNIGNQVLVDTDREFSIKNVALFKYVSRSYTLPLYLNLFLETVTLSTQSQAVGGAQPFVSLSLLRNIPFPLPPVAEQARIVTRVTDLRRLCADLRQRLTASQTTQSYLAEALVDEVA